MNICLLGVVYWLVYTCYIFMLTLFPEQSLDNKYFDECVSVRASAGINMSRRLAAEEGIITGISGGSSFAVGYELARKVAPGTNILVMLPDTAERYLTSPLFDGILEDMSAEERGISESTPGYKYT